jgi:glycerophosphoryl diester phosphodiesterase
MNVLAIAHRAGNSLAGLRQAGALGVDVIECDVHEQRGRLEVRHLKTAGPLPFLWDRGELVSASAPRLGLDEMLAAEESGTTFMLDIKGRRTSAARAVATFLHQSGHHRPVLVCGRHWPSVDIVAQLPFAQPVASARNRWELDRLRRRLAGPTVTHGVSVHQSLLDTDVVSHMRSAVDLVMTWPINDLALLDAVLALGVTGIISDNPDVLRELIRRRP